ncbi:MAG TPA: hypothetical protein VEP90_06180 [Methylomirabilota bacterium]|nr:hypothetical protein [Methylomirabilota bacterium]
MLLPGDAEIIHALLNGFLLMGVIGVIFFMILIFIMIVRWIWEKIDNWDQNI